MKEYALGLLLLLTAPEEQSAQAVHEAQPVLKASDLAPPGLLKGPHFVLDERVPTLEFLAQFTLRSDYGTIEVRGRDMLAVRVREVGALGHLHGMSKTEEFLKAAGNAATRPAKGASDMTAHSIETGKGAPGAVGRFFDRVEQKRVGAAPNSPGKSSEENGADVANRVGGISADVLGYEQERRGLAKRLGVDPYTTNALLAGKLDEVARVTFSGRLALTPIASVEMPSSIVPPGTTATRNRVWDTPPGDLVKANERRFLEAGADEADVRALVGNPWYSLSTLTALGTALDGLPRVPGRQHIVAYAARVQSEDAARLVAAAAAMLAAHHATQPFAAVLAPGPLAGRAGDGGLVVPAPLDYVAWTERVARFAKRPELRATNRTTLVTGTASPRAKKELAAAGWTVRDGVQPAR
jgi:hypothetical protein